MLKKIVLSTVLIGIIRVLVAGAIIRTLDKTDNVAEARGGHGGQGGAAQLGSGAGGETGRGAGQGDGIGGGEAGAVGLASVDEWLTFAGTVSSVSADALVVQTGGGEQIVVENRPWWFAQEQGFAAEAGDQVTLVGFYEEDSVEVAQIDNATNGRSVVIRDETGRPLWAGRGRQGG